MSIDITQPLELEDGRPVRVATIGKSGKTFCGTFAGPIYRDGRLASAGVAWFDIESGFVGGDPNQVPVYFTCRNVEEASLYEPDL